MRNGLGILVGAMALIAGAANGRTIGPGSGESSATLLGVTMKVSTYRPTSCTPRLVLASFPGLTRNRDTNRDATRPLADKLCAVVVSPEFDDVRLHRPGRRRTNPPALSAPTHPETDSPGGC
ncbi:MAG TPA: hypothetical protein VK630_08090 [Reyranella sp.]|nr:hypothetical protein [Reyranella sp.]